MSKQIKFDRRFLDEVTAQANTMTVRELEWFSAVGLSKELAGKYSVETIRKMEDIYWIVAAGKRAAA